MQGHPDAVVDEARVAADADGRLRECPDWQRPYFEAVQEALEHVDARPNVPYWEDVDRAMNRRLPRHCAVEAAGEGHTDRYAESIQRAKMAGPGM